MTKRSRAREATLQLLFQHDYNPSVGRDTIESFARGRLRDDSLVRFCLQLYDGTLSHRDDIDGRLTQAAENWRVARMAGVERNLLRMGAYEILFSPETPLSVAINEAIELARRF